MKYLFLLLILMARGMASDRVVETAMKLLEEQIARRIGKLWKRYPFLPRDMFEDTCSNAMVRILSQLHKSGLKGEPAWKNPNHLGGNIGLACWHSTCDTLSDYFDSRAICTEDPIEDFKECQQFDSVDGADLVGFLLRTIREGWTTALLMRMEGASYAEIAEVTVIPKSTLQEKLPRIIKALKDFLNGDQDDE